MCQYCEENERRRLTEITAANPPKPCLVCQDKNVIGVGTWRPDKSKRLAAGGNDQYDPIFAYWLCAEHAKMTDENAKLISQAIIRAVREGESYRI